jgi:methionine salvage enolase-phosphatase E1
MEYDLLKNVKDKKNIEIPLFVYLSTKIPYKQVVVFGESEIYQTKSYLLRHHYRAICRR